MSASDSATALATLDTAAEQALAAVERLIADGATQSVPDETAQRLLLAGVRLFARKVDDEFRTFPAVPPTATVSPTEVAVVVTELMRGVDLNMFDMAMWGGRARPGETS